MELISAKMSNPRGPSHVPMAYQYERIEDSETSWTKIFTRRKDVSDGVVSEEVRITSPSTSHASFPKKTKSFQMSVKSCCPCCISAPRTLDEC